jgi:pyrroline-5-carboxylate reductase
VRAEAIDDAALACDVLVLAVKPQQLRRRWRRSPAGSTGRWW